MCTLFSISSKEIWFVGPSIQQRQIEISPTTLTEKRAGCLIKIAADWPAFRQAATLRSTLCRSRLIVLFDSSQLSHEELIEIRIMREKHSWFAPIVYFDQPDLGKVIHAFNADLAGYCASADTIVDLMTIVQAVNGGKLSYTKGFCDLLRKYGFPVVENSQIKN